MDRGAWWTSSWGRKGSDTTEQLNRHTDKQGREEDFWREQRGLSHWSIPQMKPTPKRRTGSATLCAELYRGMKSARRV